MLYSSVSMATDRSAEGQKQHMMMTFEQAVKLMPPGVETWFWVADFEGFSMKDLGLVLFPSTVYDIHVNGMPHLA